MTETATGNDQFTAFWNEVLAAKFERFRNILLDGLSYHSAVPLRTLDLRPGAAALDVGCGWGDTALQLARIVGPQGSVLGLDCCEAFLEKGRRDAVEAGLRNVRFVTADVQTYPFKAEFDFCFSRFGMMFFSNPVAAMRNISRALKPGGRLMFVTWRSVEHNPWAGLPKAVVLKFLPPPGEDAQTCGPGPFSMANTDTVRAQLKAAGFEDIAFHATDGPVMIGSTVEQALQFQLALGPAGEIFREAGDQATSRQREIEAALSSELGRYRQPNGEVVMQSSSWTITARKPSI
ncbi:MAG TPA: class I SAM-dependent methyltransferase [Casimicrobiaceae bacterium]|jgi:ubiquinone/menaquinone biosynthesis C-methylase UbiE|nr:class I SAM-dependent methyltransferase [Casimicrobiaceae bacterium]HEX3169234.1 class I SAM-dependent methyltransferase [Burkholderiales bacterium]